MGAHRRIHNPALEGRIKYAYQEVVISKVKPEG